MDLECLSLIWISSSLIWIFPSRIGVFPFRVCFFLSRIWIFPSRIHIRNTALTNYFSSKKLLLSSRIYVPRCLYRIPELVPEPLTGTRRRATHTGISPPSRKPHHGEPWTLSCGLVVVNIPFFVVYEYSTCMLLNIPHVNIYFVHTYTHKHTHIIRKKTTIA